MNLVVPSDFRYYKTFSIGKVSLIEGPKNDTFRDTSCFAYELLTSLSQYNENCKLILTNYIIKDLVNIISDYSEQKVHHINDYYTSLASYYEDSNIRFKLIDIVILQNMY